MVEILENLGTPDTAAEANVVCEHGFQKGEVVRSENCVTRDSASMRDAKLPRTVAIVAKVRACR